MHNRENKINMNYELTYEASLYSLMASGIKSAVSTALLGTNNDSLLIFLNGLLQKILVNIM